MRCTTYPDSLFRGCRSLLAAVALSAVLVGAGPAIAHESPTLIATRMTELKQSPERWLEIDLSSQRLIAWEGNKPVYAVIVSTGKASTPTPTGTFAIQSMHRLTSMEGDDYYVPNVPFVMYYSGGYGIHGAYWHHNFGTPVSHGCTNVAVDHAEWLFSWSSVGTPVVVHE